MTSTSDVIERAINGPNPNNNRLKKKYDNTENFIKEESSGEEGGHFQTEDEGAGGMRNAKRNNSILNNRKRNI